MILFADSRDPIFNSRDLNRVPKTLKNLVLLQLVEYLDPCRPNCFAVTVNFQPVGERSLIYLK